MSGQCAECGAALPDGRTCADDFHQLLFWENERPELGEVHHLMVLCYHLQHPSLYSAEGLAHARQLLAEFVNEGVSPPEMRRRQRAAVASGARGWSITARPGNRGSYGRAMAWRVTVGDVVASGIDTYRSQIRSWADSIDATLQALESETGTFQ